MKTISTLFTILLLLVGLNAAIAQDNDPNTTRLLDAAKQKIDQMASYQFDFDLITHRSGKDDVKSGSYVAQGEKYAIEVTDVKIMSDGNYTYRFVDNATNIEIYDIDKSTKELDILKGPSNILGFYKTNTFTYQLLPSIGGNSNFIAFKPIDKEGGIVKITLSLSPNNDLESCQIFMRDASNFMLKVKNFKANPSVDSFIFDFDEKDYPDAEIDDLRLD